MGKVSQGQQHYMELHFLLQVLQSQTTTVDWQNREHEAIGVGGGITRCPCDVRVIVYTNQHNYCGGTIDF